MTALQLLRPVGIRTVTTARVLLILGIGLLTFAVYYANGLPGLNPLQGEPIVFYLGAFLLLGGLVARAFSEDSSDQRIAAAVGVTLGSVLVFALVVHWYWSQTIDLDGRYPVGSFVSTLLLLPPAVGLWTGLRERSFPGADATAATSLVFAATVTWAGSVLLLDFALAGIIVALYTLAMFLVGVGLHLLCRATASNRENADVDELEAQ